MRDLTQDRHRCHNPACGRPFAVVYHRSAHDVPIPLAVACPRCGSWDTVMVPTGAEREATGTWVLPLDGAMDRPRGPSPTPAFAPTHPTSC